LGLPRRLPPLSERLHGPMLSESSGESSLVDVEVTGEEHGDSSGASSQVGNATWGIR